MPATSTLSPTGDAYVDGVLIGVKWAVNSLTFSFPTAASFYGADYGYGEPDNDFAALNPVQQASVRTALAGYASVANLTFTEIAETATQHADLRYAESDTPFTAWAYYPSPAAYGGDSWFNNSRHSYDNPVKGNYAWSTVLHETGHALGLKHPHQGSGFFGAMPADRELARIFGDELSLLCRRLDVFRLHQRHRELPANLDDVRHRGGPTPLRAQLRVQCRRYGLSLR